MKDFLVEHGIEASVVLVLACYNLLGTALVACLDKLEAYLATPTGAPVDPNSTLEKVKRWVLKSVGWASSVADWLIGNKAH